MDPSAANERADIPAQGQQESIRRLALSPASFFSIIPS
jgi:hypothetical protein